MSTKEVTPATAQKMTISQIRITPIGHVDGLVAFASCVINGRIILNSIGIHRKLDGSGYRLTYPTKKSRGHDLTLFHPLDPELSKALEAAIFAAYEPHLSSISLQKLYEQPHPVTV